MTKARQKKDSSRIGHSDGSLLSSPEAQNRLNDYAAIALLVTLGLIYSLSFFRHFVFPNPDFTSFVRTGQQWLSLHIPGTMKRGPVFSIISALISNAFGAQIGSLTGVGLYNALMFPLAMVLIYLLFRRFSPKAAIWVAFLAGISPWMVRMSSQPLAEMTFVVLLAATALAVGRNSRWAYVFAMLGSLARWDLAALIPAVALLDLIRNRKLLRTIIYSLLVSFPFAACMVITYLQLHGQTSGAHYLQVFSKEAGFEFWPDLKLYWQNICSFVAAPVIRYDPSGRPAPNDPLNHLIFTVSAIVLAAAFIAGSLLSIIKKRWPLLLLLLAGLPYVIVHAAYPYRLGRFCVPFGWAGLVISAYALVELWNWFAAKNKPALFVPALQVAALVLFALWSAKLYDTLRIAARTCPGILRIALVSAAVSAAGYWLLAFFRSRKLKLSLLLTPAFLVLSIFSSAATTGFLMGDGQQGANFKHLGLWFKENAGPNDKMLSTMPGYIALYANLPLERFLHVGSIKPEDAPDFGSFIRDCQQRGITLVAWDSRLFNARGDLYYKLWGLDRWDPLGAPFMGKKINRIGPCRLVHIITDGSPLIAVWRIHPPEDANTPAAD